MKNQKLLELKSKFKNAIFIEILIWILVLSLLIGGGYGYFYSKYIKPNLYHIELKDVDGIIEGSPVRFMGIVIGHVRNLNYTPNAIQVEIIVTKKDVKIPSGSIASVEFTGLAGSKSIELYPPENDLSDIGIIPKESLRLTQMLDSLEYMGKTFTSLKNFVDGLSQKTFLNVFSTVTKASKMVNTAQVRLQETNEYKDEVDRKVQNVIKEEKKLEQTLDKINENTKKINSYFKN